MNHISILIPFSYFLCSVHPQQREVTSNGDEVILNSDGIWKYAKDVTGDNTSTANTNKIKFIKPFNAFFIVKSSRVPNGVYIDPKK